MAAPNYGTDLELADQYQAHFPMAAGLRNLVRAIFRRVTTSATQPSGQAIYQGRCMDVRDLFAARMDAGRLPSVARQVESTCLYDERIEAATARVTFDFPAKRLKIAVNLTPAEGPTFALVLSTDGVTVEILSGDGA